MPKPLPAARRLLPIRLLSAWLLPALLLPVLFSPAAFAQEAPHRLPRLTGEVVIDGRPDEAAWQAVPPLSITQYEPVYEGRPSERTEIRIAHDDRFLYVAGRFYHADVADIRTNSLYRDRSSNDDQFGVILDTFSDRESARWFWTTPAGILGDRALSDDGNARNDDWNTYWDAAAVQDATGWFAEMRIPFSSLGFQIQRGQVTMGLIAYRFMARKNERHVFPALPPDRSYATPSRAQDVLLEGVVSQKPIYVTPYTLGGVGQTAQLNGAGTAYRLHDNVARDVGLDVKYHLTSNLTLDATLNTDFAQVEADNQQVNLSRFSLFFPEKRQFFQERSGIFSFGTLGFGADRLFHSRRIGLYEGQPVSILGGLRLVGRLGGWDVGVIEMQTARSHGRPAENYGVARVRRQVFNENSYAGALLTSRVDEAGAYNIASGLDGRFRLTGSDYLTLKWAQTFDAGLIDAGGYDALASSLMQVQMNRRSSVGFNYWLTATRGGGDFLPGMGFTTRRDFTELGWFVSYDWLLGEQTPFRRVSPAQFFGFVAMRNADRSVESALFEYDTDLQWKSGANLWADFELHYEDLRAPLSFTGTATVPAGSYAFLRHEGGLGMAPGRRWRTSVSWGVAQFFDGHRLDAGLGPTWHVSRHLDLSGSYNVNVIRFPDRRQGFEAHVARLRVQAALNKKVSLNAFIQYSNLADRLSTNLRFRYNFSEGSDLWVVYDEGFNTDRHGVEPVLLRTSERTVLLKYTYTFAL